MSWNFLFKKLMPLVEMDKIVTFMKTIVNSWRLKAHTICLYQYIYMHTNLHHLYICIVFILRKWKIPILSKKHTAYFLIHFLWYLEVQVSHLDTLQQPQHLWSASENWEMACIQRIRPNRIFRHMACFAYMTNHANKLRVKGSPVRCDILVP